MKIFSETGINITNFLSEHKQVILFGASLSGTNALKVLKGKGIDVLFFCDNDTKKHGASIEGIKIYHPSQLLKHKQETVLISSDYFGEIALQLKGMGIPNFYYFGFCFDFDRWQGHFDSQRLKASQGRIDMAHNLLDDEGSRELFETLVRFRYTFGFTGVKRSPFKQYLHPKVKPTPGDTIIDGGAWTGNTAEAFCRELSGRCQIYSFEPDGENFRKLQQNVVTCNLGASVNPVKAGLWAKSTVLKFNSTAENSMQYQIDENGSIEVQVTSVDEFVAERKIKIDLIKMDIEGSEVEALLGSQETIRNFRPRLQICSYHQFDDLWEIPILIKELYPEYSLFLGHHSQNLFETIVYAHS